MMRKKINVGTLLYQYGLLIVLSVGLLLFVFWTEGKAQVPFSMKSYVVEERELEKLLSGKKETKNLLTGEEEGLFLNGYALPFEKEENRFYISQSLYEDKWQGSLESRGVKLYVSADEYLDRLPEAIRTGHEFEIVLQKGKYYQRAGIVLTGMPVVNIVTSREEEKEYPEEDVDNYHYNSETRYYGIITVFQSGRSALPAKEGEKRTEEYKILKQNVCYHLRGQTSLAFPKKGYALKLLNEDEKGRAASLFGMRESEKWKLIALYSDSSKIRDKVSMQLWKEMAEAETACDERGPEMEYCEVIMDGQYIGIYGMMLPVNEETKELGSGDVLYKLLERDMPDDEHIQASIYRNLVVCYPVRIRYPENKGYVGMLWEPLRKYFACKYWGFDLNAYSDLTYVENLADFYIFIQTVAGSDNELKNTYIVAKRADSAAGYKMITIPWDLNYTFGDRYVYEGDRNFTEFDPDTQVNYVEPMLEQIFRSSENEEAEVLKERWKKYRQGILKTESITGLMQDNMDYMIETGAFGRDSRKWEDSRNNSDLSEIKKYVEERMVYLDAYFGNF